MEIKEVLAELTQIYSPAGFEEDAAKRIAEMLSPFVDDVHLDAMGSVIAHKSCGIDGAPKLLIDAHMDEVGFIVTGIDDGFVKFQTIGTIDPRIMPGMEVVLLTQPRICGIIGCLPPHVLSAEEREKVIPAKDLFIDIGLCEEAEKLVKPGTFGVFKGEFTELLEDFTASRALDDKSGVAALIYSASRLKDLDLKVDVYYAASVQEEIGMRGAGPVSFFVRPDFCIAVDVTFGQTPDSLKTSTFKLGAGAVISVGPNMNTKFTRKLFDICEKYEIPHETEVLAGNSGTNLWPVQISREGVPTALLSIPLRYMHSPVELLKTSDIKYVSDVLFNLVKDWGVSDE